MRLNSICVHGGGARPSRTGSIPVPIYQAAAFAHIGFGQSTGYDYSRTQNPTREYAEGCVAALEGGAGAVAFSTGMAAIAAVCELFSAGDEIVASADLYGGTFRLFGEFLSKRGIKARFADTGDEAAVMAAVTAATKAVFVETPTNPMMRVSDLTALGALCKKRGLLFIVDNTFLTPIFQQPIKFGADIVVHSATKYLSGHNDVLAGVVVCKEAELVEKIRYISKSTGACLSPFDAYLTTRGIKTLSLRMRAHEENALAVALWLEEHPKVAAVHYVGLPSHKRYNLSKRQTTGFGGMLSFEVRGGAVSARAVLEHVELITFAESLGGVESLITHPATQTHAEMPPETRLANGITDGLLRLSVGIEDCDDLIVDLERALARV